LLKISSKNKLKLHFKFENYFLGNVKAHKQRSLEHIINLWKIIERLLRIPMIMSVLRNCFKEITQDIMRCQYDLMLMNIHSNTEITTSSYENKEWKGVF